MYCIYLFTMQAYVMNSLRNNVLDDVSMRDAEMQQVYTFV